MINRGKLSPWRRPINLLYVNISFLVWSQKRFEPKALRDPVIKSQESQRLLTCWNNVGIL